MKSTHFPYRNVYSFVILIFLFGNLSCKKGDYTVYPEARSINKFFEVPAFQPQIVQRLSNALKQKDLRENFVASLVKSEGYPVWDKVIIKEAPKSIFYSSRSSTSTTTDSIAIIPLAVPNSNEVKAYIHATLELLSVS
jgi:hypothetical protein